MDWFGRLIRDLVGLVAGPVRVRQKIGQCKNLAKPSRSGGSTHDPGEPEQYLVFFFKCGFSFTFCFHIFSWLPFSKFTINTRRMFYFSMWDLKFLSIYTLCFQEKNYFFNVRFEAL
jgi:hypothetical protein